MDARVIRSRQAIVQAGLSLLIKNNDATLVDIAKAAEVGRATVYRQFKDKEELQEVIALYCLDRFDEVNMLVEKQAKDPLDAFRLILQNILPLYTEFTFLNKFEHVLMSSRKIHARMRGQDDEVRELIALALKQELISSKYSVDWIFYSFEGLLWAGYRATQSGCCNPEQAAELAFLSFKDGVSCK